MSTFTAQHLELAQIVPSATNPRKSFDPVALEQLAESMKEIGVTVPVLVRVSPSKLKVHGQVIYELVSGHRRLKAAAIAGLETIPAIVRELTDGEALDIQMVENLQRADLHPMDEAAGYQALIDAAADRGEALTQEELAHKVGKPLSYVAQRVKLLDAIPVVQRTFSDGLINIGHALVLARLTPEIQEKGLRQIFDPNGYKGKDKTTEELIDNLVAETKPDPEYADEEEENLYRPALDTLAGPVSRLKQWVEEKVTLNLANAPWNLADDYLHPTAGPCLRCEKRTGSNPALFAELTVSADSCTDPDCYAEKKKTFVSITLKAAEKQGEPLVKLVPTWGRAKLTGEEKILKAGQWVEAVEGECKDTKKGLMTKGDEAGSILTVCYNQRCKVHKHQVDKTEPLKATKDKVPAYGTPGYKAYEKEQERLKKLYVDRETPIREAVFSAIKNALPVDLNVTRDLLIASVDRNSINLLRLWKVPGVEKLPKSWWDAEKLAEEIFAKHVMSLCDLDLQLAIFDSLSFEYVTVHDYHADKNAENRKPLMDLAKQYGIDFSVIEGQVKSANPELYEDKPSEPVKEDKPPKTPKKAAKGKKAAKAKVTPAQKDRIAKATKKAVVDRKSAAAGEDADDLPDFKEPGEEEGCEYCDEPGCEGQCLNDDQEDEGDDEDEE